MRPIIAYLAQYANVSTAALVEPDETTFGDDRRRRHTGTSVTVPHVDWARGPRSIITLVVHNVWRYTARVLQSFRGKDTERVWQRRQSKRFDQQTQRAALRKLLILDAADQLRDLRVPPGNRLEKLKGDRANTYSIRINDQWRICFRWTRAGPEDVEIVDYH
jgi:proteic killer suppression protein